jgi:aspartate/methionine/tyrosine aminotransferase
VTAPFELPPYPYDRLNGLRTLADDHEGGCVDLSAGTPTDPPPAVVREALAGSDRVRGYPPSVGTDPFRQAVVDWLRRRFAVEMAPSQLAACVGTKELVAGMPHWLRLRRPDRDTVLYPDISYTSYAMGADLAGCRAGGAL